MARLLAALLLVGGCAAEQTAGKLELRGPPVLKRGEEQREQLCARGNRDSVTDLFCGSSAPGFTGLDELRRALGLSIEVDKLDRGFVLSGHSTSLVHRSVSAINPRIIFVRVNPDLRDVTAMAFARGEQFSEVVVRNRTNGALQFYLLKFTQPCNASSEGCLPGDLLTPETESGWTSLDVYGEEDLENTPLDCRVCHQAQGPGTRKIMRMQELQAPWNHWFYRLSEGGRALLEDYYAAKGDEPFVGVEAQAISRSQPGLLAFTIFSISPQQPNEFESRPIQDEVVRSAAEQGGKQPMDNTVPGYSETWSALYETAKRGEAISVPFYNVKVTDPDQLAAMTQAYSDYRDGTLPRRDLPDIRDVYPDDPELRAHMGLDTEPGLSGEEVLVQACGLCHNQRLDQTISRSRFDVDLDLLDREAKDRAISRIGLPADDPGVMPPAVARQLSDQGRARLIELLER